VYFLSWSRQVNLMRRLGTAQNIRRFGIESRRPGFLVAGGFHRLAASTQLGWLSRSKRRDAAMTSCKAAVLTCILAALSFTRRMFS
jgi:hypothetical protein